jgi:HEAT repeat protein
MNSQWTATRKIMSLALLGTGLLWAFAAELRGNATLARPRASAACQQSDAHADSPRFQNSKVETRTLQGSLSDEVHRWAAATLKAQWLGYSVPAVNGEREICCSDYSRNSDGHCGLCTLEHNNSGVNIHSPSEGGEKVRLEGSREIAVLFRAEGGKIGRIRAFSLECTADAGGLNVLWLGGVKAGESVDLVEKFVTGDKAEEGGHDSLGKSALVALALHADPSADRALQSFVTPNRPEWLRRDTAFWLGNTRGAEGLRALQKMAQNDASPGVREQVTFALSVSREPDALPEMIRMAHEDQSPHVRGQALFWLAQKAGKKAENAITGAIQNDPDTEVKKKAVFALSQMPREEGVPKLIEVAQTNRNPEVRKQAMFWLGQSEDPRALAFFEKILAE